MSLVLDAISIKRLMFFVETCTTYSTSTYEWKEVKEFY
jgi:hypothetical protein